MSGRRVFFYVQHLLGIGHLKRAAVIARAMAAGGLKVTLASGGLPLAGLMVEGLRFLQLPPAWAADSSFKILLDAHGRPIDAAWKRHRRELLLEAWRASDPHALMFELYPFGRRQMRFELLPLLEAAATAAHRPVIITSVRDVLGGGQKNPARQDEMLAVFERYFDRVLVHGDPGLIAFDTTFRHAGRIADKLHYTGYVVDGLSPQMPHPGSGPQGKGEVIVSAGGGAVGRQLLEAAVRARPHSQLAARTWRILAGVNASRTDFEALVTLADAIGEGRVVVERTRTDFTQLLANCTVSVSQGGYNTLMETLQVRARAVVVPFAGGAETEQAVRAQLLAERGVIEKLEENTLTPATLAAAVDRAARRPRMTNSALDLRGAQRAAALVSRWTEDLPW
ncbi:MAG: glycosyl transferase [Betaproteobacteria bacterium]|nr:glycosyl transferase [Betaproteobacteria bacterium]